MHIESFLVVARADVDLDKTAVSVGQERQIDPDLTFQARWQALTECVAFEKRAGLSVGPYLSA